MPKPPPIWDQRPCHGLRDAYANRVQPLEMCQSCGRWLHGVRALPPVTPQAKVASPLLLLVCRDRVKG